ncbi:uncharacterized protein [Nicotiana sylvestris]|uniref:uncharacterized protein n=1 Tax=Nicotiana sylvestris TaxID=4096 RepID=UPI00388CAE09
MEPTTHSSSLRQIRAEMRTKQMHDVDVGGSATPDGKQLKRNGKEVCVDNDFAEDVPKIPTVKKPKLSPPSSKQKTKKQSKKLPKLVQKKKLLKLVREEGYRAEIGKLKRQIERLIFENNVQVASEQGEKNKLAKENLALKARIRQVSKSNNDRQKRRSDERLIAELRNQVSKSREDLERSEACIARMRVRWAKGSMARRKHLQQVIRDSEISIGLLRETNSTLQERVLKQARDVRTDRKRCYDLMARMEKRMERFQDRLTDNAQILGLKNRRIEQLFVERDNIQRRIDETGHYIYMSCVACE